MPLPKRRHSRTRGRKRRTGWKLEAPNVVDCPHCHQARLSHHICPHCGYYNGRQVLSVKEA
ncbi:MAG TPA: 50S ribosomal protein L32 [candidate division Zixibacteria bacterium]|nr:50S ribosomal protein L32 [candidate division Zixibacteria bacterium]